MKTVGMSQQLAYLDASEGKRNFAVFAEQGTGKSWMTLADVERAFIADKISGLIVFAPAGVHTNWIKREAPKHLSIPWVGYAWLGKPTTRAAVAGYKALYAEDGRDSKPLRIFTINFESMLTEAGRQAAQDFIAEFRCIAVVDESKKIGNPDAKRTEKIIKEGRNAIARRILSGKPLTKSPNDLFSQFDFLKSGLLGTKSYRAFVAQYSVLIGPTHPKMQAMLRKVGPKAAYAQVVDRDSDNRPIYRNLDQLRAMLLPHTYRVRKDECLDLPPKYYVPLEKTRFKLTKSQQEIYDTLKKELTYVSEREGEQSYAAIAARTKMKQVTSGFVNVYGEPEYLQDNPRMELFLDIVDDLPEDAHFIVWAIYREEIAAIVKALNENGYTTVEYHGGVKNSDRESAVDDFQDGKYSAFVCNKAAYAGLTLTRATYSIYYSSDFDNDVRSQSEDRNHRIGTTGQVTYIDIVAEGTIDEDIVTDRENKNMIADYVIDGR